MCQEGSNGLKQVVWEKLVENLSDVAELKGELRISITTLNEKIDRLLVLEGKVEQHSISIARIKTVWTVAAGFIALLSSLAKELFFTRGR